MWARTIIVKRKNASIIYRSEPNLFIALLSNRRGLFLCRPVPRRGRWLFLCKPWKVRYIGWFLSAFLRHRYLLLQQSWFLALFNFVAMLRVFFISWGMRRLCFSLYVPLHNFFRNFFCKKFCSFNNIFYFYIVLSLLEAPTGRRWDGHIYIKA